MHISGIVRSTKILKKYLIFGSSFQSLKKINLQDHMASLTKLLTQKVFYKILTVLFNSVRYIWEFWKCFLWVHAMQSSGLYRWSIYTNT